MHTINLENYDLRTDLIIEKNINFNKETSYKENNIEVTNITNNDNNYTNILFNDITDKTNYNNVLRIFIKEFKKILLKYIKEDSKVMIIGLGNSKSTPDALGPNVIDNILVTRHLFALGEVEKGYMNVCAIKPQVTGVTGIETYDAIKSLIKNTSVDIVIVIDALKAGSIKRVNKTIQITDAGINPGSGVGNDRKELSKRTLNIPIIAIGIPTIVELSTIVGDTLNIFHKKLNKDKEKILGLLGTLNNNDLNVIFKETLDPINYNLMVTPKEIDFLIEKFALLISSGINKSLHKNYNSTK